MWTNKSLAARRKTFSPDLGGLSLASLQKSSKKQRTWPGMSLRSGRNWLGKVTLNQRREIFTTRATGCEHLEGRRCLLRVQRRTMCVDRVSAPADG